LKQSSESGDTKDIKKSAEGAWPPGWSPHLEKGGEGEQKDGDNGEKTALLEFSEKAEEQLPPPITKVTLSKDIDQERFSLYKPLLQRILTQSGNYDESIHTSYDRGLYMLLNILRKIFWPDVTKDWTGRIKNIYNTSHGIDLKRRILYYLAGALYNQFQIEMLNKNPLNRRQTTITSSPSSSAASINEYNKLQKQITLTRLTPSLRYTHEIIKMLNRACIPSLLEERLLHQIHLMMSHDSAVTHTLSIRQHKRKVCTDMGIEENIWNVRNIFWNFENTMDFFHKVINIFSTCFSLSGTLLLSQITNKERMVQKFTMWRPY
jgi:hypothetical protein